MKLISCSIQNFGKLKDFTYDFEPGFNVICHENGWGKSTLLGFIKAMFYGFPATRSTDLTQNERARFMPWQGGIFGGSLVIELDDGKQYRIERTFGAKESDDVFQLFDLDTNLQSFNYTKDIGDELFSINSSCFEKSAFISEYLSYGKADYSSIQNKLIDVDDIERLKEAQSRLKKKKDFYHISSKNGKIDKAKERLSELKQKRIESENSLKTISEKKKIITDIRAEIEKLSADERALQSKLSSSTAIRTQSGLSSHKNELIDKKEKAKQKFETQQSLFSGNIPNRRTLEEMRDLANEFYRKPEPKQIETKIPMWFPIVLFSITILLFALSFVFIKNILPLFVVFLVLSFVGLVVGILLTNKILHIKKEIQANKTALEEYEYQKKTLQEYVEQYPALYSRSSNDIKTTLYDLGIELDNYNRYKENYLEASDDLAHFEKLHSEEKDDSKELADQEIANLTSQINDLNEQLTAKRSSEADVQMEIGRLSESGGSYTAISQEIAHLEEEIKEDEEHLHIIEETMKLLDESYKSLTSRYTTDIQRYFRNNLRILTQQDLDSPLSDEYLIESYTIASDFSVNVNKFGKTRSTNTLSRGGRDMIALCTRFAISEALFSGQKPFMVLDDPFINLDDEKVQTSLGFLRDLAKDKQIIYVCCHSSRI